MILFHVVVFGHWNKAEKWNQIKIKIKKILEKQKFWNEKRQKIGIAALATEIKLKYKKNIKSH